MFRATVPKSEEKEKSQKKESIDALIKESHELQEEIRKLEVTKKGIKEYIEEAVKDVRAKVEAKEKELNEKIQIQLGLINKSQDIISALEKDQLSFKEYAEGSNQEISRREILVRNQIDEIKEKNNKLDERRKEQKKYGGELEARDVALQEKATELKEKANELLAREIKINRETADYTAQQNHLKAENEKLSKTSYDVNKKEANLLRYVKAVDEKEAELIKEKESIEKEKLAIKEREDAIEDKNIESIVLGKKNTAEATRLKGAEKDLINREAKLSAREKLFKTKITGG